MWCIEVGERERLRQSPYEVGKCWAISLFLSLSVCVCMREKDKFKEVKALNESLKYLILAPVKLYLLSICI